MLRHSTLPWRSWEWPGSWASELMPILLLRVFPLLFTVCPLAHLSVTESPGPASPSPVSCGCLGEWPGVIFLRICISGGHSSAGRGATRHRGHSLTGTALGIQAT